MGAICTKTKDNYEYMRGYTPKKYYRREVYPKMKESFRIINVEKELGEKFFFLFVEIDVDCSGEIDLIEFYSFFGIQRTRFSDRVFGILDLDQSGALEFQEFILGIWNYCSASKINVIQFAFDIFDCDQSGTLEIAEVDALCRMLYDVEDVSADLQTILDAMDEDGDGAVTLDELVAYDAKFPQLLMPAFKTQKAMQKRVFGKRFWKKAALWRAATYGERQMLENVLMQKRRRDRRIAEEKSKEEERVRLEKEKAERAQKREEARLKKLADEEHMKKLRESETPEEREQREASENLENWIQRWRQYEKEKSEKSEEEKGNGIDRTIDVGGGQNEIKEGLESKEDDSQFRQQDLLDIRKGLRSGGNRLILAIARCFKSHRDRDIALKTEEIQTMVELFFMDSEGKKLLVRDMNEILRKDKSVSLFPTAAQKNRAQKQAKIEYKKKKLDAALAIVETEYASRALELQNDNLKIKLRLEKLIGDRQSQIASWTWMTQFDESTSTDYYCCTAINGSTWIQPFRNRRDRCYECNKRYCAALRCMQCVSELCEECDPVVHFGNAEYHQRFRIPEVESRYREGKRAFDVKLKEADNSILIVDLSHSAADDARRAMEKEIRTFLDMPVKTDFVIPQKGDGLAEFYDEILSDSDKDEEEETCSSEDVAVSGSEGSGSEGETDDEYGSEEEGKEEAVGYEDEDDD